MVAAVVRARQKPVLSTVSVLEAAELLGVSVSTIRRLIAEREFPNVYSVKTAIRIPRGEVEAYEARNRKFHVER
jgi:excisionase family DNA binding protein